MPSAKKVAWAQLRVGVMAFAALVLVGILIFLLAGSKGFWQPQETIYTYMSDSAAITRGQPVRLNGVLVGEVGAVELTGETTARRVVRFGLLINSSRLPGIPKDSEAAVGAESVLGTKYINIKKGQSETPVQPGDEIKSQDTSGFDEVVATGYSLLASMQGMVKRIDAIIGQVEKGQGSIGKFLTDDELYRRLNATVVEVQKLTSSLNEGRGTLGRLVYDEALYDDARRMVGRVEGLLQELQEGRGTAGKLLKDPALYDELRATTAEVRTLIADLNAAKGTAGKLLKSDELHNRLARTLSLVDGTIEKINSGQGTLGQLLVNQQMYENINGATREIEGLLKDFRANPKKFLTIQLKLF